jgi:hypothetical protein
MEGDSKALRLRAHRARATGVTACGTLHAVTANDFRHIALGLRDVIERAHMEHPDFRVNGRIFASLNHDESRGMVVLTPEQQEQYIRDNPAAFQPESGAWGRAGCTRVLFDAVDEETLGQALTLSWQNSIAKGPTRSKAKAPAGRPKPASRARTARHRSK